MAQIMIKNHTFFNSASTGAYSAELGLPAGAECIKLEVSGTVDSITVEQMTDIEADVWQAVAGVAIASLSKVSSIAAAGSFLFPVAGCQKLRLHSTGTPGACTVRGTVMG